MSISDWFPIYLTLKVSLTATSLTVVIGLGIAWVLAKKRFWGKNLLDALLMQPLVIPPTVLGYYLLVTFGRGAWLGRFLEENLGLTLIFTWRGAVLAALATSLPLFIKPARAAMEGVDPHLENAARLLGRSELGVFRAITLPLAWRGVLAGVMMAFARSMGDFGATLMVAGNIPGRTQTVSIAIYDAMQAGDVGVANTLVVIMTVFSISVLLLVGWITAGRY
ncbi:MAG: molybdate ABC transporter permease subunit [SAR324 cluster bacterium]|nr:molybdate ABC transporter permease subunit [SAR324 cluster bacterium]MCH8885892.1 molybdate ABC transporter permease subunit [SAR324 cluster bacterium]